MKTEKELKDIEHVINGEDHPGNVWFIETMQELVDEVRKLQSIIFNKECGNASSDQ